MEHSQNGLDIVAPGSVDDELVRCLLIGSDCSGCDCSAAVAAAAAGDDDVGGDDGGWMEDDCEHLYLQVEN